VRVGPQAGDIKGEPRHHQRGNHVEGLPGEIEVEDAAPLELLLREGT